MILCGYPCIGKSRICKEDPSLFMELDCNKRDRADPKWCEAYGDEAIKLSRQGKIVFVSLHRALRAYLKKAAPGEYALLVPKPELKETWIAHLKHRADHTGLPKDAKALECCSKWYDDDMKEYAQEEKDGAKVIWLDDFITRDLILSICE